jgi:Amidohydrolase family
MGSTLGLATGLAALIGVMRDAGDELRPGAADAGDEPGPAGVPVTENATLFVDLASKGKSVSDAITSCKKRRRVRMSRDRNRSPGGRRTLRWGRRIVGPGLVGSLTALAAAGLVPVAAGAQQRSTPRPALVFDRVTVVDVEQGQLVPNQRVVIAGNRIQAVGNGRAVAVPQGAQVVNARGKYLIPGLWDLHVHPNHLAPGFYPLFVANGVTGIRDAGSDVPLDRLIQWRRAILAGTRLGPPRQLLSGPSINQGSRDCVHLSYSACADSASAGPLVDSLKAAGADMIKPREVNPEMYFAIAAEARRLGIPFGGHAGGDSAKHTRVTVVEASDSGARIVDHVIAGDELLFAPCMGPEATVERCRPVAERFHKNGTWLAPTWTHPGCGWLSNGLSPFCVQLDAYAYKFWWDAVTPHDLRNALRSAVAASPAPTKTQPEGSGSIAWAYMYIVQQAGLPILAGTDVEGPKMMWAGFSLPAELASYVTQGMTPLEALRTATLNPAKMLHGTDSLGTVAPGKLADLVLLDADPLADITNTTTIRAVVANGRYFDRAALDRVLADIPAEFRREKQVPVASLAGQAVAVLPIADPNISIPLADPRFAAYRDSAARRVWADSLIGAALTARAPAVSWVLPPALRTLAGRSPATVSTPDGFPELRELFLNDHLNQASDSLWLEQSFRRFAELRQLAAAAGARVVLVPSWLDFFSGANGDIQANLRFFLLDVRANKVLRSSKGRYGDTGESVIGRGATPAAAFAAALAAAVPRPRAAR